MPQRIAIAGVSGSGKTTLARRIHAESGLPYVEIDGLFHGPGWQPRPSFVADVDEFIAGDSWVIEWQYSAVRSRIAARADTLLWLDLPTAQTLAQLTRRTVRRRFRREELWNGNFEGPLGTFFTDPDHIVRWGIRTRNTYRTAMPTVAKTYPNLEIVRLRSHRDSAKWFDAQLVAD